MEVGPLAGFQFRMWMQDKATGVVSKGGVVSFLLYCDSSSHQSLQRGQFFPSIEPVCPYNSHHLFTGKCTVLAYSFVLGGQYTIC